MISIIIPINHQKGPLYEQIYEFLKNEIRKGTLKYGEKLPSKRKLASENSVSVNTVDTAYSQLVAEGYIDPKPKKGFFVCEIDEYLGDSFEKAGFKNPSVPDMDNKIKIDFSSNAIDPSIFPYNTLRKIFKTIFNEYDENLLKKPPIQGDKDLRKALVKLLNETRGVNCNENQIIIGGGTDNLLQVLSFLWGRNKTIAFENPVYLRAYKIFQRTGNTPIPIEIDEKGIRIEPLEKLKDCGIYVTPSHQFPLGMSMPIDRRIRLLNFANKNDNTYIIEDDYDSEFRYNEKPLPSLQSIDKNGKVIYIGTFSKSIAPSIRISYMVLPEALLKDYLKVMEEITSPISGLEQKMIARFITEGYFEKYINKMRKIYKEKRIFLMETLKTLGNAITVRGDNAGHHLLIQLKTGLSEEKMIEKAIENGVRVYPISPYFIEGMIPKYENSVLVGYPALTFKEIEKGVDLLKKAWGCDQTH